MVHWSENRDVMFGVGGEHHMGGAVKRQRLRACTITFKKGNLNDVNNP